MACLHTSIHSLGCRNSSGGGARVWVADFEKDNTYTYGTNSVIEAFSGVTQSFYEMEMVAETIEFSQPLTADSAAGTIVYEQTLILSFLKMNAALNDLIRIFAEGHHQVIILDNNGNYFLIGEKSGLFVTEGSPGLGVALGDQNGAKLTLVGRSSILANEVNQTLTQFNLIS